MYLATYVISIGFQVVLVVKNPPAIAGDIRDSGSIGRTLSDIHHSRTIVNRMDRSQPSDPFRGVKTSTYRALTGC